MATATKTTTRTDDPAEQEFKRCECGCGQIVNPKRRFVPGHDARLKSALLKRFDGGDEGAAIELMERGWKSNDDLEARAEKREAKEKAKADRETQRDADRKAKAEKGAKPKTRSAQTAATGRRLASDQQAQQEAGA